MDGDLTVELRDAFWKPRQLQLRDHTLPVLLERFERHGVVDNFRRLAGRSDAEHRGLWFTDSDLYKWMEAAAWAGRHDLLDPVVDVVVAAQHPDGYLHSHFGTTTGAGAQPRWRDLDSSHEMYCAGHFLEAALAHHRCTGTSTLLDPARRLADHLCATFGPAPRHDPRVDKHPEIELAMARLAVAVGDERYLEFARWAVEAQLVAAGSSLERVDLAGHAVRALYLTSGIAEIALATGDRAWTDAATRLFESMLTQRSYPTGAVGGRWLGEAVGQAYELPDAMAYAESCAAVAATQLCDRMWHLTRDERALRQIETLLYNAVPCGVGAEGDTWFYSQPHAVGPEAVETNPWLESLDFGQLMLLEWFPPCRHDWFDVTCCPPNLARLFATVHHYVAELPASGDRRGDLLIHLPVAGRITGRGWDVEIDSPYPDGGRVAARVHAAPNGRTVRLRRPDAATSTSPGGDPHTTTVVAAGGPTEFDLDCGPVWWETDPRVEGASGTVFLRAGPVVHCVEGVDLPGVDLRMLTVDVSTPVESAFALRHDPPTVALHRPASPSATDARHAPVAVATVPYHRWGNRGPTTMRIRFPRR